MCVLSIFAGFIDSTCSFEKCSQKNIIYYKSVYALHWVYVFWSIWSPIFAWLYRIYNRRDDYNRILCIDWIHITFTGCDDWNIDKIQNYRWGKSRTWWDSMRYSISYLRFIHLNGISSWAYCRWNYLSILWIQIHYGPLDGFTFYHNCYLFCF